MKNKVLFKVFGRTIFVVALVLVWGLLPMAGDGVSAADRGSALAPPGSADGLALAEELRVADETTNPSPGPTLADGTKCQVLFSAASILSGKAVTLEGRGDREAAVGLVVGDTRYVPARWKMTGPGGYSKSGTFGSETKVSLSPSTVGTYTAEIIFARAVWRYDENEPVPTPGAIDGRVAAWYPDKSGDVTKTARLEVKALVTLNPMGGKAKKQSLQIAYGANWSGLPTVTLKNHAFKGWYTKKVGGKAVENGAVFKGRANITLYAHWKVSDIRLDASQMIFAKTGDSLSFKTVISPSDADRTGLRWQSSNKKVAVVDKKGKVTAKGWGSCVITASADGKSVQCQVTVARKWVAITFDDGPGSPTPRLLDGLKSRHVRATFFVVGTCANSHKSLLTRMEKEGHEIANHTWNHPYGSNEIRSQLARTDAVVKKATGRNTRLMRPPGGTINDAIRNCGKAIILWSVDPKDWRDRNADTVYNRVIQGTRSGSIILLHDIHPTSVTAGLRVIDTLKRQGYAFVTVSEILGNPKANKVYNSGSASPRTMKIA